MKIPFIDLKAQYEKYKHEIDNAIESTLSSSELLMEPKTKALELELSEYCNTKYAICCSNGTNATLLSLIAIGIKENDEVITTAFSFLGTAESIAFLGAKPVFVDIKRDTFHIDKDKIEDAISPKTKAIIVFSAFGQCADMDEVNEIAKKHNLFVIEDASQSLGALYKNKKSCSLTDIAYSSFFPSKPLACYGDGGAIFTNDKNIANKLRILLNHGHMRKYEHYFISENSSLDMLQASILRTKLKYLDEEITKRQEIAKKYDYNLKNLLKIPFVKNDRNSVYAQYTVMTQDREKLVKELTKKEIPTEIHYPTPLHLQNIFKYLNYKKGDFPVSEEVSSQILSLPMSAFLKESHQDYICKNIREILQ